MKRFRFVFCFSGGDSCDIVLMLQQGQHRAVRGLLAEAQIIVLSATRYDGDPSPQCWTAGQTQPSIREILVGLWWIRTARLVSHLTIYNETKPIFLGGKHLRKSGETYFTSIVNVVVESVELQAVGVNTAIISGTVGSFHYDFLCDAIFY